MDIKNENGTQEHIETPMLPDTEQWSDPYMVEAPRIKIKETGDIVTVAEINFASGYVTFIVDKEITFTDNQNKTITYMPGQLCMKVFEDILIE